MKVWKLSNLTDRLCFKFQPYLLLILVHHQAIMDHPRETIPYMFVNTQFYVHSLFAVCHSVFLHEECFYWWEPTKCDHHREFKWDRSVGVSRELYIHHSLLHYSTRCLQTLSHLHNLHIRGRYWLPLAQIRSSTKPLYPPQGHHSHCICFKGRAIFSSLQFYFDKQGHPGTYTHNIPIVSRIIHS